jgi:hypothetical protein
MDCQTGLRIQGSSVSTAARLRRTKPGGEAHRWWARAAYNGQDRAGALAALQSSGLPAKTVDGVKGLLSAMARGDALIKGAVNLKVPRRKGRSQNSRYYRLLQWRLVMGYAGFEIFTKACIGRVDRAGLKRDEVSNLLDCLPLPAKPHIGQPVIAARSAQWLLENNDGHAIDKLEAFLHLGEWERDFLHAWFKGRPLSSHLDACQLAKILRHATVHGVLSPEKCRGLGFVDALIVLPKILNEIRAAATQKLYEAR